VNFKKEVRVSILFVFCYGKEVICFTPTLFPHAHIITHRTPGADSTGMQDTRAFAQNLIARNTALLRHTAESRTWSLATLRCCATRLNRELDRSQHCAAAPHGW
jgi:hypothetical protein